jgi:hypothetical protein
MLLLLGMTVNIPSESHSIAGFQMRPKMLAGYPQLVSKSGMICYFTRLTNQKFKWWSLGSIIKLNVNIPLSKEYGLFGGGISFEIGSPYVGSSGWLEPWSFCLSLLSAGITHVYHNIQQEYVLLSSKTRNQILVLKHELVIELLGVSNFINRSRKLLIGTWWKQLGLWHQADLRSKPTTSTNPRLSIILWVIQLPHKLSLISDAVHLVLLTYPRSPGDQPVAREGQSDETGTPPESLPCQVSSVTPVKTALSYLLQECKTTAEQVKMCQPWAETPYTESARLLFGF